MKNFFSELISRLGTAEERIKHPEKMLQQLTEMKCGEKN